MQTWTLALWVSGPALGGCEAGRVVIQVEGSQTGLASLHAQITVSGQEALPIPPFPSGTRIFGVTLPQGHSGGSLLVEVDGLGGDRCSLARGSGQAEVATETAQVRLSLRPLAAPSCCNTSGFCWDNPLPSGIDLRRVYGASAQEVWIVGEGGAVFKTTASDSRLIPVTLPTGANLYALHGSSAKDVWVGGEAGALFRYDGTRFQQQDCGTQTTITAIFATSATDVWAAAGDGLYHYTGKSWQRFPPQGLLALWASGPKDLYGVNDRGAIVHYDGTNITTTTPLPMRRLHAIWGSGPSDIWAAGQQGLLLHSDGTSWTIHSMTGPTWHSLWGRSDKDIWVVGESATQRFDGTSWQSVPAGPSASLVSVYGGAAFGPIAVGSVGTVRRFVQGAWNLTSPAENPLAQNESLRALWGPSAADLWAVGETGRTTGQLGLVVHFDGVAWSRSLETQERLKDLSGFGSVGWAVGEGGTLLRLEKGRFIAIPSGTNVHLRGVYADAPSSFFAVGEGGIALRGVSGEVKRVEGGDRTLYAVHGFSSSDVWAVGEGGAVLHSTGGGFQLEKGTQELSRGATLRAVFGDRKTGDLWVAGEGGVILRRHQGVWIAELSGAKEDIHRLYGAGGEIYAAGGNEMPPGRGSLLLRFNGQSFSKVATGTARLALFGLYGTGGTERIGRLFVVGESGAVLRLRTY